MAVSPKKGGRVHKVNTAPAPKSFRVFVAAVADRGLSGDRRKLDGFKPSSFGLDVGESHLVPN
jgi:hypothetical protein